MEELGKSPPSNPENYIGGAKRVLEEIDWREIHKQRGYKNREVLSLGEEVIESALRHYWAGRILS